MLKYIIFSIVFYSVFILKVNGQIDTTSTFDSDSSEIFRGNVSKEAAFPGGIYSVNTFIKDNIYKPKKINGQSKVFIQFVITKDGSIKDVIHFRGGENCPQCIKAAIDVIKKIPKWSPAMNEGDPVNRLVIIPITFSN